MTIEKLIEMFEKIKELATDTKGVDELSKNNLEKIEDICDTVLLNYKVEQAIEELSAK